MAEMFVYNKNLSESKELIKCARETVASQSNDRLEVWNYFRHSEAEKFLQSDHFLDLAMMEICRKQDIDMAERIRLTRELLDIMLISDSSISPMDYMTPKIRACSLLLRPYTAEQARQVVREFVASFYRKQSQGGEKNALLIENREGKMAIPFSQIYYLEVREKKIYIRLKGKEYSKYDTLENVMRLLPEHFLRCHRSFVFNVNYFEGVKLSQNIIYLENKITVPLSRSYKANIKEYLDGLRIL